MAQVRDVSFSPLETAPRPLESAVEPTAQQPATSPAREVLVREGAARGQAAAARAEAPPLAPQPGGSRAGFPDEFSGRGRIVNLVA